MIGGNPGDRWALSEFCCRFQSFENPLHRSGFGVVRAVDFQVDLKSTFEILPGTLQVAHISQDQAKVVEANGHVGMARGLDLVADLQKPA